MCGCSFDSPVIPTPRARQRQLDNYAHARGWDHGPFRSYKAWGFTISMSARGYPRKFIAARADESRDFDDLEALEQFITYVAAVGKLPKVTGPRHKLGVFLRPR